MRSAAVQMMVTHIRQFFKEADWYSYVQEDVAKQIDWVIENLETVGSAYRQTFETIFDWMRQCRANAKPAPEAESIIPPLLKEYMIAEPLFECGRMATKIALFLEEFTDPRDPDVKAAIHLCHQIGILESKGLIPSYQRSDFTATVKMTLAQQAKPEEQAAEEAPTPEAEHIDIQEEQPQDDDDVI